MADHVPSRRRILLFGARGQLGSELSRVLSLLGTVIEAERTQCDLTDPTSLRQFIEDQGPTLMINAAAYTAVDRAESEPEIAAAINAAAPGVMAAQAARWGIPLVHYSTDYVYDGYASLPYREDHPTSPLSVYGQTKLDGDRAIAVSGCAHLIFRTTWVYGHQGGNFVKTILRLAQTRESLSVVDDQFGAPTWARLLAEGTALAIVRADTLGWERITGVYHMSAAGSTNWCEFARTITSLAQNVGLLRAAPLARIEATSSLAYGAAARRPTNSVLDNSRLAEVFGIRLPDWQVSLRQFMADSVSSVIHT